MKYEKIAYKKNTQIEIKPIIKMERPKGIYAVSNYLDRAQELAIWNNSNIQGIFFRTKWDSVEPSNGEFDWSFINSEIDYAHRYGKKVILSISAGENSPKWLKDVGVPFDIFDSSTHQGTGKQQQLEMPIAFDDMYVLKYNYMISKLAENLKKTNRYDKVVHIMMCGLVSETAETRQPYQGNSVSVWVKHGYTKKKIIDTWEAITKGFIESFPDKSLGMAVIGDPVAFPSINDAGGQCLDRDNNTAELIIDKVLTNYKDKILVQFNSVTSDSGTPLDSLAEQGCVVAYQERIEAEKSNEYIAQMARNVINHKGCFLQIFNKTIKAWPLGVENASKLFV